MSLSSWVGRIQGTGWELIFRMEHVSLLVVEISSEIHKLEAEHVPAGADRWGDMGLGARPGSLWSLPFCEDGRILSQEWGGEELLGCWGQRSCEVRVEEKGRVTGQECVVWWQAALWSHFRFPHTDLKRALLVFPAQWCKCRSGKGGGLNFVSECDRARGVQTRIHGGNVSWWSIMELSGQKRGWGHPGCGGGERRLISAGVHACWRPGVSGARWKDRWWLSSGVHLMQPVFGAAVWDWQDLACGRESDYLRCVEKRSCKRGEVRRTKRPGCWKDRMCVLCEFSPRDV